jgi:uncharacterized protein YceK
MEEIKMKKLIILLGIILALSGCATTQNSGASAIAADTDTAEVMSDSADTAMEEISGANRQHAQGFALTVDHITYNLKNRANKTIKDLYPGNELPGELSALKQKVDSLRNAANPSAYFEQADALRADFSGKYQNYWNAPLAALMDYYAELYTYYYLIIDESEN